MPPQEYPHLQFVGVLKGRVSFGKVPRRSERTEQNKANRSEHYRHLKNRLDHYNAYWAEMRELRMQNKLPDIEGVPLWVQIDPEDRDADFLRNLGFEIVSEEEDGFILFVCNQRATGLHSAWASPRCKTLVASGYLERNERGHYRLKKARQDNAE